MIIFNVNHILLFLFCSETVFCFTYLSKDGVEIQYTVKFKRECRGEMDIIVTLESIALPECVLECGMRPDCKALSYMKIFKKCNIYSSDGHESDRNKGSCVEILAADINVKRKPCPECTSGKTCNPAKGYCETTECPVEEFEYGIVSGNIRKVGYHVQYTCNDGNTIINKIECLSNGLWNITAGKCSTDVINVAIGKPTSMSSVYYNNDGNNYDGSKGVDGNLNQSWSVRSCFHTNDDLHSWWRVDLGQMYRCFRVVLYNRLDCCKERASDLDLMFGTTENNMYIVRQVDGQIEDIHTFNFPEGKGARYVQVMLRRQNSLHLCEVQVFGFALNL
ncbi:uncharacterized protein LOC132756691 [Ruditapes philippinarum]|uniref:uncharacterized protein LOC132756691 n=1 Tax=Ruditapes philippinarum TaxID=129788 RepID=UPI00295C2A51|nr:uncharacterized protein LOC132756691 [Ruditapes philippinarum]